MLVLLGDSRALFTLTLLPVMRTRWSRTDEVRAAYLGAPNGDDGARFALFAASMEAHDITQVTHVRSDDPATHGAVDEAELVFLAGGDPLRGLRLLRDTGLLDRVVARHHAGAMVMGSSAGSVLLGARVWDGDDLATVTDGARLVPFAMDAHAEPDWPQLTALCAHEPGLHGLGLRSAGGAWVEGDLLTPVGTGFVRIGS